MELMASICPTQNGHQRPRMKQTMSGPLISNAAEETSLPVWSREVERGSPARRARDTWQLIARYVPADVRRIRVLGEQGLAWRSARRLPRSTSTDHTGKLVSSAAC